MAVPYLGPDQLAAGPRGVDQTPCDQGALTTAAAELGQGRVEADTSNGRVSMDGGGRAQKVTVERNQGTMDVGEVGKASATVRSSNGSETVRAAPATTAMPTPASPTTPASKN